MREEHNQFPFPSASVYDSHFYYVIGNHQQSHEPPLNKELSMLVKPPVKFTFDLNQVNSLTRNYRSHQPHHDQYHNQSLSGTRKNLHGDNPTYFQESAFGDMGHRSLSSAATTSNPKAPIPLRRPTGSGFSKVPPPPVPIHRFEMISNEDVIEEQEIEVFLNSSAEFDSSAPLPKTTEKKASPFGKFTQLFWRSKGKPSSIGSSEGSSGSRSASSGVSSPPFTPDSLHSIYTSSIDSDSHSSSHSHPSTNSDQGHYPELQFHQPVDPDIGRSSEYTNVQPVYSGRMHSLPSPTRGQPPYYNTQNLGTFQCPNVSRRHSISAGPSSPSDIDSVDSATISTNSCGYLVPIQTRPVTQGVQYKNVYLNDPGQKGGGSQSSTVEVDVHTPTSSHTYSDMFCDSSASTAILQSSYTTGNRSCRNPCSSDSSSTIDAATTIAPDEIQPAKAQPQAHTSKFRREYTGNWTDCEEYCKFCSSASLPLVPLSRSNKMNVGILSCQGCFFSKSAVSQIIKIFETIVGPDQKKINVNIQTYDIQEIGTNVNCVELHRAKIQIVIISHSFLDHLRHASSMQKQMSPINRILRAKRVIAVLLSGVVPNSGSSNSQNRTEGGDGFQQYLLEFSNWETLQLKPSSKLDSEFYKKFAQKVIGVYSAESKPVAGFSIFPKKVTKCQSKVAILFKNPIENGDEVSVQLGRGRKKALVEEVVLANPYTGIIQIPASLFEDDRSLLLEITVTLNDLNLGLKALKYDHNSHVWSDDVPESSENFDMSPSSDCTAMSTATAPEYYDMPRPSKQDYCIPPIARPIVPKKPKKVRPISPILENSVNNSSPENPSTETENSTEKVEYANVVTDTKSIEIT